MTRRPSPLLHAAKLTFLVIGAAVIAGIVATGLVGAGLLVTLDQQLDRDFGTVDDVIHHNDTGIILTDRHGEPFFRFDNARYKILLEYEDIPEHTVNALLASEDREFFEHDGISIRAILRAAIENYQAGKVVEGGSTITQQLVKNVYLSPTQSYYRKLEEAILARHLEHQFTKEEILEMYFNTAYFGRGAYGLGTAAQIYFGKPAQQLTLAESALLIALLPAPSNLSPITGDAETAFMLQRTIINEMGELAMISPEDAEAARNQEIALNTLDDTYLYTSQAPHFAFLAYDEIAKILGEKAMEEGGYRVRTTIDLSWQRRAEEIVREQVSKIRSRGARNGGAVVLHPGSGEIRALVGSIDWQDGTFGKYNVALARRQPGSSFKPYVYAAALEEGLITPTTELSDRPIIYTADDWLEPYIPRNYDGRFHGSVTVREALGNSLNVPAVEVIDTLGVDTAIDTAESFGITTLADRSRFGLSLALGSGEVSLLEHTQGYAVFANEGEFVPATTIMEITDRFGTVIHDYEPHPTRVLSRATAYLISSILSDNETRRNIFGNTLSISRPAAAKTGTSQEFFDAWTMGYTPQLVVGVWVGNNEHRPMRNLPGALGAAPIWRTLMEEFLADRPHEWFEVPPGVEAVPICRSNGLRATYTGPGVYTEYFKSGTEPEGLCYAPRPEPEEDDASEEGGEEDQPAGESEPPPTETPTEDSEPSLADAD